MREPSRSRPAPGTVLASQPVTPGSAHVASGQRQPDRPADHQRAPERRPGPATTRGGRPTASRPAGRPSWRRPSTPVRVGRHHLGVPDPAEGQEGQRGRQQALVARREDVRTRRRWTSRAGVQQAGRQPRQVGERRRAPPSRPPAPDARSAAAAPRATARSPARSSRSGCPASSSSGRRAGQHARATPRGAGQQHPRQHAVADQDRPVARSRAAPRRTGSRPPRTQPPAEPTCRVRRAPRRRRPAATSGTSSTTFCSSTPPRTPRPARRPRRRTAPRAAARCRAPRASAPRARSGTQHHVVAQDVAASERTRRAGAPRADDHAQATRGAVGVRTRAIAAPTRPPTTRHLMVCRMSTRARNRSRDVGGTARDGRARRAPGRQWADRGRDDGDERRDLRLHHVGRPDHRPGPLRRVLRPDEPGDDRQRRHARPAGDRRAPDQRRPGPRRPDRARDPPRARCAARWLLGGLLLARRPAGGPAARPRQPADGAAGGRCRGADDDDRRAGGHPAGRAALARARDPLRPLGRARGWSSAWR